MTRFYTCEHGRFTPAPKGYYRIEVVVAVGTALLGLSVLVSAGFAFISTGVAL